MKTQSIVVIDYGVGNLFNVESACKALDLDFLTTTDPQVVSNAARILLPGVGAFRPAMQRLHDGGLIEPLRNFVTSGRPLLGICLGMQLLFSTSEEHGSWNGLNFIPGKVVRLHEGAAASNSQVKIPHIGWNMVNRSPDHPSQSVLDGLPAPISVYFNHSFMAVPVDPNVVLGHCSYGENSVASVIRHNNIHGCQFHPERSADAGLRILYNFAHLDGLGSTHTGGY